MQALSFDLTGRVALVTGASRGIGRACALGLARLGADVIAVARSQADLHHCVDEIQMLGRRAVAIPADLTRVDEIRRMADLAAAAFGRIDVLVNNAGINIVQDAVDVTEETWDRVLDTNLKGVFFCAQSIGKLMIAQRSGKIINMASTMSAVGFFQRAAYCASKAGVVGLTKVLAIEWAPYNVLVNAVAPTYIMTALTAPLLENRAFYEEVVRRIPLGRVGKPEDVVGAVCYLASDAANLVTGSTIYVDGGWTAW